METIRLSEEEIISSLPQNYRFIKYLDKGGFAQVVQCQIKDTFQNVAVKLPLYQQDTQKEISILTRLMEEGCDQRNIVKFLEVFDTRLGKAIIFEALDMCLFDYRAKYAPLCLSTVRTITKQVATALEALKEMSIIHIDLKQENVMLVNHKKRPLKVKLIDFGLAIPAEKAKVRMKFQLVCYRPPEIILGLPWNEAVDVWCLGTMFAELWLGIQLFPYTSEYETLRIMIKVFGAPPDHVLSQGLMTQTFFHRVGDTWVLKTCEEMKDFYKRKCKTQYAERFSSLHHLVKEGYSPKSSPNITQDIRATDLLAQMLKMEASARITPSQILQHPFICPKSDTEDPVSQEQPEQVQQTPVRKSVVTVIKLASPENTSPFELDDCKPLESVRTARAWEEPIPVPEQQGSPLPVCEEQAKVLPVPKRKVRPHPVRKRKVHPLPPPPAPSPEATVLPPPGDTAPKKKRTVLQRVLSWLKRFCCCSVDTKD